MTGKTTVIPKGYRLTVTSWENDGDFYNTKISHGWTKDEVAFLVPFIKTTCDLLGNAYSPSEEELEKATSEISKVIVDHPVTQTSEHFKDYFQPPTEEELASKYYSPLDGVSELLYDFVGGSECYWTRVCDSIKVEYVSEDIHMDDVTEEFL